MKGRKPIPDEIKRLNGNPGKRPLNEFAPRTTTAIPVAPFHLDAVAREEWERVTQELADIGVLCAVDRCALAGYCVAWSRWVKAELALQESELDPDGGLVLQGKEGGGLYQHPMLAVANKAMDQLHKFASEFGMTPSSRTRVKVNPAQEKSTSSFMGFIQGGK